MCTECDNLQTKILRFRQLLAEPIDPFTVEQLTKAVTKLQARKAELHPEQKEEHSMTAPLSEEAQLLFDAAARVIERSRMIVAQTRDVHAACAAELRDQELRFAFLRELRKPK
jgi:hypothetical protein